MNTIKPEDIAITLLGEVFQITPDEIGQAKESLAKDTATTMEKPIGNLNDFEQKIYALLLKKAKRAEEIETANEEESREYENIGEDISLLKDLIYNQIKRRFKLDRESPWLRADFQVVIKKKDGKDCSQ